MLRRFKERKEKVNKIKKSRRVNIIIRRSRNNFKKSNKMKKKRKKERKKERIDIWKARKEKKREKLKNVRKNEKKLTGERVREK